jgi:hypothetical protein
MATISSSYKYIRRKIALGGPFVVGHISGTRDDRPNGDLSPPRLSTWRLAHRRTRWELHRVGTPGQSSLSSAPRGFGQPTCLPSPSELGAPPPKVTLRTHCVERSGALYNRATPRACSRLAHGSDRHEPPGSEHPIGFASCLAAKRTGHCWALRRSNELSKC